MSPEDADRRIILSRHTLARYVAMVEEIDLLERVAYRFNKKRGKCERLAIKWRDLMGRIKAKLN